MKELPPGIHDLSMSDYVAYPAYSRSTLVAALETAGHAQGIMEIPAEVNDPMRLGTATHMAFLEPAEVAKVFALYRGKPIAHEDDTISYPKRVIRGGAHWEAHQRNALSQGLDPHLTMTQYDHALSMGEALRLKKATRDLFTRSPARREIVILFNIEARGIVLPMKVRIDCLIEDEFPTQADIKTTESVSDRSFHNSIYNYGYDIQAWLYRKAYIALTGMEVTNSVIAAVEKKKSIIVDGKHTHAVRVFDMVDWLEGGKRRGLQALNVIAQSLIDNDWPNYPDRVERSEPPTWYRKQLGLQP